MSKQITKLKKKADRLFSIYIRKRDSIEKAGELYCECITCGDIKNYKQMHAGHFISRRYNITRYDERNVNAQCSKCNTFHSGEQYIYSKKIDEKYGNGTAEDLHNLRNKEFKLTEEYLQKVIELSKS